VRPIFNPGAADDGIFVGYKEVTDCKTNGIGDILLL
jgi:hypothetical protein